MIALSTGLPGKDVFPSVHLSLAEASDARHPLVGASISSGITELQELRLRFDTNLSDHYKIGSGAGRTGTQIQGLSAEWIFHKNGVHQGRFLAGAGLGYTRTRWSEIHRDAADGYRPYSVSATNRVLDIHAVIGCGFGPHLRLESRINTALSREGDGDKSSNDGNFLLAIGATWSF